MPRAFAIVLVLVGVSVLLSPLGRELYVGDETKYSQVVREMREGSFFVPTLEGSPFTHKPPLHFWIVWALTYPFGLYSIWPFVIPSLVAFACLLWLMKKIGGPMAAFVCGTALLVWGSAQTARMDVGFTFLLAVAAWMVQRHFDQGTWSGGLQPAEGSGGLKPAAPLLFAGIATGLAALLKGPMAPVIILCLIAFEALRRRRFPRGNYVLMLVAMIAIPLLWLVPAIVIGGEAFWREIVFKQTVGRAVGAWVHKSPPWFYLVRAPLTLLPWFFLLVVAVIAAWKRNDERAKFAASWVLAVLVPYSLLSSKLDVYMMVMIPPVALLIARLLDVDDVWTTWGRRANVVMLLLLALVGLAGLLVQPHHIKEQDGALIALPAVRALFVILLAGAIIAIVITLRGRLVASTIATGFVPIAALAYAAIALVPLANELASTRPLVRALGVVQASRPASHPPPGGRPGGLHYTLDPEQVGLYVCPHLWVRGMKPELARAPHMDAAEVRATRPLVLVVRRKNAQEIADVLSGYRQDGDLRMIGKWFDVYRR